MKRARTIGTALLVILALASSLAAETFDNVEWMKAAAAGSKKGDSVHGNLSFDAAKKALSFTDKKGNAQFSVPYDNVKSLLYERTAKPRYAAGLLIAWPLLFTKSKKHYLTIQYTDADGKGQFALLHLDKGNVQQILAIAEAQTGKKVERSEER